MVSTVYSKSTFVSYGENAYMLQRSQVTGSCPAPQKNRKASLISNFRNVSLHTNPLQSSIVKYNKNETCDNLLLNKNLKGKACRSYDGEVMPFLKLPPRA